MDAGEYATSGAGNVARRDSTTARPKGRHEVR
jgi:hypothetical protein